MKILDFVSGKVIKGKGFGSKLGFRTINLDLEFSEIEFGVYACMVRVFDECFFGVLHFGKSLTVGGGVGIEVHLFGFDGNLYGENVDVYVYNRIRDSLKFDSVEDLREAIVEDVVNVKNFFKYNL